MSTVSDVMTNNSYTTPEKSYKNNALGADLLTPHATLPHTNTEIPMKVQPIIGDSISQKKKMACDRI
jgi:hypothetical protein